MSTGSMRSPSGGKVSVILFQPYEWLKLALNIKEAHVFGVAGDEAAPRLDVLAHQNREQLIRRGSIIQSDLTQDSHRRIHRGLPQLLGVHLAETLVPLDA